MYVYFLEEEALCHIHLFSFSLSRESNHFLGRILFVVRTSSTIMKKTSSSVSQELKKNYSKEGITLDKKRGILILSTKVNLGKALGASYFVPPSLS